MPLPIILGIAAAAAGTIGVGTGIRGGVKAKKASDTMKFAQNRHNSNIEKFEAKNDSTTKALDKFGKFELEILKSFKKFADTYEKIQNRPEFKNTHKESIKLPEYNKKELEEVYVGAGVLLGGLGGAVTGTAGGFAAAGATTSAVMALGTASTGTAIASLSGAAATNATMAAIGGGSLAAGGGGIALGTTILGASTLGVGLLVGGVIFNFTGSKLSDKADEAYSQMLKAEKSIKDACKYLDSLKSLTSKYRKTLTTVNKIYSKYLEKLSFIVNESNITDWEDFTPEQKMITENTVRLVGMLHKMCKVKLVIAGDSDKVSALNDTEVNNTITEMNNIISDNEAYYSEIQG